MKCIKCGSENVEYVHKKTQSKSSHRCQDCGYKMRHIKPTLDEYRNSLIKQGEEELESQKETKEIEEYKQERIYQPPKNRLDQIKQEKREVKSVKKEPKRQPKTAKKVEVKDV